MSRLLVLRGSEPLRVRGLLSQFASLFPDAALFDAAPQGEEMPTKTGKPVSHDLGFFIDGEPLIQRGKTDEVSAHRALFSLRTDHLMSVTGGPAVLQGVFRFGSFLCAVAGQLHSNSSIVQHTADLPLSVRSNLRGRSEVELFFHHFLSRLHDADPAYLSLVELPAEVVVASLCKTLRHASPVEPAAGILAAVSHGDSVVLASVGRASLCYKQNAPDAGAVGPSTLVVGETENVAACEGFSIVPEGRVLLLANRGSKVSVLPFG